VRYYFCEKLALITSSFGGKEYYKKNFYPYHFKFLQENEPEMKSIATLRIADLSESIDVDEIINKLIPYLKTLQND